MAIHAPTWFWSCGLLVALCQPVAAVTTAYLPDRVAEHTRQVLQYPYVQPTPGGNQDGIIGTSRGWDDPYIPIHDLYAYRIGRPDPDAATIVLISGNHNTEHAGSWLLQGVVDFLVGPDPHAEQLRRAACFYVYPMVNPDGRYLGLGRGNPEIAAAGLTNDHNRVWNTTGLSTIDAFTSAMRADTGGDVDYFFDFHNTLNRPHDAVFSTGSPEHDAFLQALLARWPDLQIESRIPEPGMARGWAMSLDGLAAHHAYTPEPAAHWPDAMYLDMGVAYALALHDVLIPEPSALALWILAGGLLLQGGHLARRPRS